MSNSGDLTQTQQIEPTQVPESELPSSSPPSSPSPPTPPGNEARTRSGGRYKDQTSSPLSQPTPDFDSSAMDLAQAETIDTQALRDIVLHRRESKKDQDAEMLGPFFSLHSWLYRLLSIFAVDMETQVQPLDESQEDTSRSTSAKKVLAKTRSLSVSEMRARDQQDEIESTMECICGVTVSTFTYTAGNQLTYS